MWHNLKGAVRSNSWSHIYIHNGDELRAEIATAPADNLRTKVGRRRLQRFIHRLQKIHDAYEARYGC